MDGGAQAPHAGAADRRLWLARHGRLPVPLDATGRRQAAELAEVVERLAPAALVCSDIARARETAGIVGAHIGVEPVVDARFAETETGDWTDRTFADVIAEDPEGFARFAALDRDWGFPGGESFADQRARVLEGIAYWRSRDVAGHVVIVCHGNTIRLATLTADGPATDRPDNGSLVGL